MCLPGVCDSRTNNSKKIKRLSFRIISTFFHPFRPHSSGLFSLSITRDAIPRSLSPLRRNLIRTSALPPFLPFQANTICPSFPLINPLFHSFIPSFFFGATTVGLYYVLFRFISVYVPLKKCLKSCKFEKFVVILQRKIDLYDESSNFRLWQHR